MIDSGFITNVLIGLGTGTVSGLFTGWLVTKYYRNKDENEARKELKFQAYSIFIEYLEDILMELEILEKNPSGDRNPLVRLLKKRSKKENELRIICDGKSDVFFEIIKEMKNVEHNCQLESIDITKNKRIMGEISLTLLKTYECI